MFYNLSTTLDTDESHYNKFLDFQRLFHPVGRLTICLTVSPAEG